jgi:hypothetical protein
LIALVLLLLAWGNSLGFLGLVALLFALYSLVVAFVFPAAMARYALTDEWFTMFDFGWVLSFVGKNLGRYLVMLIVAVLLALLLNLAGAIALFVGAWVTSFWTVLMFNHLLGQLVRQSAVV